MELAQVIGSLYEESSQRVSCSAFRCDDIFSVASRCRFSAEVVNLRFVDNFKSATCPKMYSNARCRDLRAVSMLKDEWK